MFNMWSRRGAKSGGKRAVGILATDGTLNSGLFSIRGIPKNALRRLRNSAEVMAAIHSIKKGVRDGSAAARLEKVVLAMRQLGCEKFVLGCTEISIYYEYLRERQGDVFIDPLRLAAAALVQMAKKAGC
jgi:aspartate racemase